MRLSDQGWRIVAMNDWLKFLSKKWSVPVTANNPKRVERPRRPSLGTRIRLQVDSLERREVLSTATITPFISIPGHVGATGQTTSVAFQLSPGTITSGKNASTVLLGFKARPTSDAVATPAVSGVVASGLVQSSVLGSTGIPFLSKVSIPKTGADSYAVTVAGLDTQAVDFALDSFLPGDVNGDLEVDSSDLKAIQVAYGSYRGDANYNGFADINADGKVGALDKLYATKNLGAKAVSIPSTPQVVAVTTPVVATTPVSAIPVTAAAVPAGTPTTAIPVTLATGTTANPIVVSTNSAVATNQLYYLVPVGSPQAVTTPPPTVQIASLAGASVTLSQSTTSTTVWNPVTFKVGVTSPSPLTAIPTGTVAIAVNGQTVGVVKLVNGTGTFVTSTLNAGSHAITATYSGDSSFTPLNVASATVQVTQDSSLTKVDVNHFDANTMILTAWVNPGSDSAAIPSGHVTVLLNGVLQGTAPLVNGSYRWSLGTAGLASGMSYTVQYSGDANFTPSTSTPAAIS
jgi:hypothetical protein